jgi:hypothetical protein
MKFIKKPIVIDAIKWNGENFDDIKKFIGVSLLAYNPQKLEILIKTLEGQHLASNGDWIIKGIKGEFYPCKPDIFEITYEAVNNK